MLDDTKDGQNPPGYPSPIAPLKPPRRDGKEDGNVPAGQRENVNGTERERQREREKEKDNADKLN